MSISEAVQLVTDERDRKIAELTDRVRELEELLRRGTPRARAEAMLRVEGIEPIPADEVARLRQLAERRRVRSNGQAAILRSLFEAAGLDHDGEGPPPTTDELVEVVRRLRDAAGEGVEDGRLAVELAQVREDLDAWRHSNVPRILGIAPDQLAKVRALLDTLRGYGADGWRSGATEAATRAWQAAGCPLATEVR